MSFELPNVAGRRIRTSNADFERSCLVHIERLQGGLGDYDGAMMDTFCESVRLVREYSDAMQTHEPTPKELKADLDEKQAQSVLLAAALVGEYPAERALARYCATLANPESAQIIMAKFRAAKQPKKEE